MGTSSGPTISTAVLTPQQLWLATLKKWSYNSPNISPSGTLHSFEYFSPENVLFSESQTSQSSRKIPILSWFINFKRKSAETTSSKQTSAPRFHYGTRTDSLHSVTVPFGSLGESQIHFLKHFFTN